MPKSILITTKLKAKVITAHLRNERQRRFGIKRYDVQK